MKSQTNALFNRSNTTFFYSAIRKIFCVEIVRPLHNIFVYHFAPYSEFMFIYHYKRGCSGYCTHQQKINQSKMWNVRVFSHFYSNVSLDNLKRYAHGLCMQLILNSIATHFRWNQKSDAKIYQFFFWPDVNLGWRCALVHLSVYWLLRFL